MDSRGRRGEFVMLRVTLNLGKGEQMEREERRLHYVPSLLHKVWCAEM